MRTTLFSSGSALAAPTLRVPKTIDAPDDAMRRQLYLIGYDITSPKRRRRALLAVKGNATGGQKSLHECRLTRTELERALAQLGGIVDCEDDRVVVVRLDPLARVHALGLAVEPAGGEFFYQG